MEDFKFIKFTKYFLENPYDEVYLREIAKKVNLSPSASKKYADILVKKKIIIEEKKSNLRLFRANNPNLFYKSLKKANSINKILNSGILNELLEKSINITSVVLFGSVAKGEDSFESDIDILVIGKKGEFREEKFEKKLDKSIQLHFFSWKDWNKKFKEDNPFYYEVINQGIPIFGELPLIK